MAPVTSFTGSTDGAAALVVALPRYGLVRPRTGFGRPLASSTASGSRSDGALQKGRP